MLLKVEGDKVELSADISAAAVKAASKGHRQRVLLNETRDIINSDGKHLVVTVKVATKPAPVAPRAPGNGLTGRKLEAAPHRAAE